MENEKTKIHSDYNPDDYFSIWEDSQGDLYLEIKSENTFLNRKEIRLASGPGGGTQVSREVINKFKEIQRILNETKIS